MYNIQTKKRKNSRSYNKTVYQSENLKDIKQYLTDNNLKVIEKPYFFTHIILSDNHIATCSVNDIICSPVDLWDYLTVDSRQ